MKATLFLYIINCTFIDNILVMDLEQENLDLQAQTSFYTQEPILESVYESDEDLRARILKLVEDGMEKQKRYIAYLKMVNICILNPLNRNSEHGQQIQKAISNLESIIKLHQSFFYGLSEQNLVEQNKSIQEILIGLCKIFKSYIPYLGNYFHYFCHLGLLKQLIMEANTSEVGNARDIINITNERLAQYDHFLNIFVRLTHHNPVWGTLKSDYQNMVSKIYKALDDQKMEIFISSKTYGLLKLMKKYRVQYRGKQSDLYFAITNQTKAQFILVTCNRQQKEKTLKKVFRISKFVKMVLFKNVWFQNSLVFLSDGDSSILVNFQSEEKAKLFSIKLASIKNSILQAQNPQQKNMIQPYFHLQYVGVKERPFEGSKFVFKFINEKWLISQQIFINKREIQELQKHYKQNNQIKFVSRFNLPFVTQSHGSKYKEIINAWFFLNELISNKQVFKRADYLFYKLNIFEGLLEFGLGPLLKCQAGKCIITNQSIKEIQDVLAEKDNEWNSKACSSYLISAQTSLTKRLNQKHRTLLLPAETEGNEKQRLHLGFLEQNSAYWNLNKMYIKYLTQKKITVFYYQFEDRKTLQIQQLFKKETVSILIDKICVKLNIYNSNEFGLYRKYGQKCYFYQNHEFVRNIYPQEQVSPLGSLFFGKKFFFSPKTEVLLLPLSVQSKKARIMILVGTILHKLKENPTNAQHLSTVIVLLSSFLKKYYNYPEERIKKIVSSLINNNSVVKFGQFSYSFQQYFQQFLVFLYKLSGDASEQYDCSIKGEQKKKISLSVSYRNIIVKIEGSSEVFDYSKYMFYSTANQFRIGNQYTVELPEAYFIHKKIKILQKMYRKQDKIKFKEQPSSIFQEYQIFNKKKVEPQLKENSGILSRNTIIIDDFYPQIMQ